MAELLVDYITSLDGFGSAEGWPGLWGMGGPEYFEMLAAEAEREYTVLLGTRTYRLFAEFARTGAEDMAELTARPKIVFSRTLTEPLEWANTSLVAGDAVEAVRELKRTGIELRTIGSPSLSRSLLRAGLVDRYRVVVFPVVNGASGADRIYDGWPDVVMESTSIRVLDGRLVLYEAVPRVLDAPPGPGAA
ncbi:dihydrofolate reductase family protein [Leifsonia sp. NPDC080035]|uniref:Dihydrofolate reductase family protein n=1 Tax=Leifsonia sp. NPDC080035 TaxID=3143936 RepID=A0AAU7G7M5_9MICO